MTSILVYYPPNCPHSQHYKSCAKPVPSFIFAGSELAGASFVFRLFRQHPQIVASVDNSDQLKARHIFDKEGELDEATAFESYISQFPFLQDHVLNTVEKNNWIAGENAPHYLYKSHLTAKRIKDNLPHAKVFPINQ
jgi:hypothetical protein